MLHGFLIRDHDIDFNLPFTPSGEIFVIKSITQLICLGSADMTTTGNGWPQWRMRMRHSNQYKLSRVCKTRCASLHIGNYGQFDGSRMSWNQKTFCVPASMPPAAETRLNVLFNVTFESYEAMKIFGHALGFCTMSHVI